MRRVIHLHGHLAKNTARIELAVDTPAEAVRALSSQFPEFLPDLRVGSYRVIRGPLDGGLEMDADTLALGLGRECEIHFLPVPEGAKDGGLGKIILGVAIVGAAFAFAPAGAGLFGANLGASTGFLGMSYGSVALFGAGMALQGVSSMLTADPKVDSYSERERPDQRPSFLFNGAVNTAEEGSTIFVPYGKCRVGSVVVSSGGSVEQI